MTQFCQLLMSILALNLPQKFWKRFPSVPKFLYLRKQKRKTDSAEVLTSSPFKKRLVEHENNLKEKHQAVTLRKEKAVLNKVIKQKIKSINFRIKKAKKPEKQNAETPNGRKKPKTRKKDKVSASDCFITDTTLCIICSCAYNVPPFNDSIQCTKCTSWYHSSCGLND